MTTKAKVLHLLKNTPTFLSGEKIAQQLNVSRTSIWKAIKELEKEGFRFEHQAKGYRYLPSDVLDPVEISQALSSFDVQVNVLSQSESTMKDAKSASNMDTTKPSLFIADTQEQAHGRFGRSFFAQPGQGIYMSLLLHPQKHFEELPQYTLIAASACVKAIQETTGKHAMIKWVNDIYLEGKKVCGILSEAVSDMESGEIRSVIIGVGLNFSIPHTEFPDEIQQKATSLFPDGEASMTRNQLICAIWKHFFRYLADHSHTYFDLYTERSFVLGKSVSFTRQGKSYQGIAQAIGPKGELIVDTPNQRFQLLSGEVSLTEIDGLPSAKRG